MHAAAIRFVSVALLLAALGLTACSQGPAAAPSPMAAPSPTVRATPTPVPTPTIVPSATAVPVTPTVAASAISIDVSSGGDTRATLTSGHSATVPSDNDLISVAAHYPFPLGTSDSDGFHPYPIAVAVKPADLQVQMGNWLRSDTLAFDLRGSATGLHTVTIDVPRAKVATVTFTLDVVPGASAAAPTAAGPRVVTLGDDGRTIDLKVGSRFLLNLGSGYDWTPTVADPAIVSSVVGVLEVRGAQGIYEARKPGRTTLTAVGQPACRNVQPPCDLPARQYKINLVVQ